MENNKNLKLNKKRVVMASFIGFVLLVLLILTIVYVASSSFREVVDKYILMKNVVEDSTSSIQIDENEQNHIFAYDKYICILNKNILKNYNSSGKEDGEITIQISNPIISTNGKFLLIAENNGNRIYLIAGNEIIWEKELEGNIDKLTVNKNGYSAVVLSGTTYKSVIQTFDNSGEQLFKTYLSSTIAMDLDISMDNQYLAFAEINTSGTVAGSTIKLVSIQKAREKEKDASEDPIVYTYTEQSGKLVTNIKYQGGNKLVCMYDDSIYTIKDKTNEELALLNEDESRITFADIELADNIYRIKEKSSLLSTQTDVEIINSGNKNVSNYSFSGVTKQCFSYDDTIAVNTGAEVHFISTNGWLIKKYLSNQEVKSVVMCNNFAGIIYRNKIEIVDI